MRFMMLLKADKTTEAGVLPTRQELEIMGKYNEEMAQAGILLDGAGLQPSSRGARITFSGPDPIVTDGPFAETKELLAGYWMIEVKSKEEAIAWAKRAPFNALPRDGRVPEIELRQMFELSDFPDLPESVAALESSWPSNR